MQVGSFDGADALPSLSVPGSLSLAHSHQGPRREVESAKLGRERAVILMQPKKRGSHDSLSVK